MENLFALILIFSPTVDSATQERYKTDLTFEACTRAQEAIWENVSQPVGLDSSGRVTFSVDAKCLPMNAAPQEYVVSYFSE